MIANTTGRFGLTQILDNYGGETPLSSAQIQSEAPHYDFVWGSFSPQAWHAANPNVILSRYVLDSEDMSLMSGHNLAYWQSTHPDWIFYACDSNGNPTKDYAWDGAGFPNDVPLAYWLPQVQAYEANLYVSYLQANGYNALAADNMNLTNYTYGGNPNLGQTHNYTEWGCGTYDTNGNFVPHYTSKSDPTYTTDTINWAGYMQNALHNAGMKLVINHPVLGASPTDSNEQALLSKVDGLLDEVGYTHYGTLQTGNGFAGTLNWVEHAQAQNKAIFVTDYFCTGSSCSDDPGSLTAQQVDFALASYAIGNEGGEDVYISPHGGSNYSYRPEYSRTYGAPCSAYQQPSSYVYTRRFQGGMAIVNASGSATTITLPAHTYTDIEGRPVSSPLTVNSPDAYMLLTSGNGCS